MKSFFKLIILTMLATQTCFAQSESDFFEAYILQPENRTEEDKKKFEELTDISEKLKALPWGLPTAAYKLFKAGTVLYNIHELTSMGAEAAAEAQLKMASLQMQNVTLQGAKSGELMATSFAELGRLTSEGWEIFGLYKDLNEVFNSKPGSSLELMSADYGVFIGLFENLELLKAIDKHQIKNSEAQQKVLMESMIHVLTVSRQIAGLKKITAGEVVAFSLEAEIAATLLELSPDLRKQVVGFWQQNAVQAVKGQTSFFGEARDLMNQEVSSLLGDIDLITNDPKLSKGIKTSTYTAKTGILLLSLMQTKYRSADLALEKITEAQSYLEKYGIGSKYTGAALAPLSLSASLIQSGVSNGARWSIGSVAYVEYATGKGISEAASFLSSTWANLKVPSLGIPSVSMPAVSMPSFSNPFRSSAMSCSGFL